MQGMSTFDAGDHIKVKRLLYAHHGIYVKDCRVIDFSGGRNILEKPNALVQTRRRNRDGSEVSYLALAHNERDPVSGVPRARIIHNFGRTDLVDKEALARLVRSISRFLDPADAVVASVKANGSISVVDSRPIGSSFVGDRLWERLGIGRAIFQVASRRRLDAEMVERVIFSMVMNRLSVKPLSKLAGCVWVERRAFVEGLAQFSDDQCYRAMDFLLDALADVQEAVFFSVASLLNLELDLAFFDTSSTYFETERTDPELVDGDDGDGDDDDDSEAPLEEGYDSIATFRQLSHRHCTSLSGVALAPLLRVAHDPLHNRRARPQAQ